MDTVAKQVATLIHDNAQSGSASWDELNGPSARLIEIHSHKYIIRLPGVDDEGEEDWFTRAVTITVEE